MRVFLDCFPCFLRQTLDAVRFVTNDEQVHEMVVRQVVELINNIDARQTPPAIGQQIHRMIRQITGNADPYRQRKHGSNVLAMRLYPQLKERIKNSSQPLEMAVRLAIAGNVMDFGVYSSLDDTDVTKAVENASVNGLDAACLDQFAQAVSAAREILYLGDNAGEIVLDRLLIEQIGPARVTAAVRGAPAINDATRADALAVGLQEIVEVIDNGSDAPGTILDDCSPEFTRRFSEADLILAKGQGNFETLSDVPKNIYFLFKAKCIVVAEHAHVPLGTHVLIRSRAGLAAGGGL